MESPPFVMAEESVQLLCEYPCLYIYSHGNGICFVQLCSLFSSMIDISIYVHYDVHAEVI